MRSNNKSAKKLAILLDLCAQREPFDVDTLTHLLHQPGLTPDPQQLRKVLGVITSMPFSKTYRESNTFELEKVLVEHWMESLALTNENFWSQLDRACKYGRLAGLSAKELAPRFESFIRTNHQELERRYNIFRINNRNRKMVYEICVCETMAKKPVSAKEIGWTRNFIEKIRIAEYVSLGDDSYITDENLPTTFRFHWFKKRVETNPYEAKQLPVGWFDSCAATHKKRLEFALVAAAYNSDGALKYINDHDTGIYAVVTMCHSLGLEPRETLHRARAHKKQAESIVKELPTDMLDFQLAT